MTAQAAPPVALVHGLWLGKAGMKLLAWRLRREAFDPVPFAYPTYSDSPDRAAERLAEFIHRRRIAHLVGHSLGGLVALRAIELLEGESQGRLLLLACPVQGSRVARRLARWPAGAALLGQARETLAHPGPFRTGAWQVGQLAGTRRLGLGLLAGGGERPGDGTIAAAETHADFLVDHRLLTVSHTGILLSRRAAGATARFLREGRFTP